MDTCVSLNSEMYYNVRNELNHVKTMESEYATCSLERRNPHTLSIATSLDILKLRNILAMLQ